MSERTVAEETLTPGASTTCWEPTGWAEPMYSVTTALRMAALRASRSPGSAGWLVGAAVVGRGHGRLAAASARGPWETAGSDALLLALHSSEC